MFKLISWHKWQNVVLCTVVAALVTVGIVETAVDHRAATPAATEAKTADTVQLPIVMYHGILDDPSRQGQYVITPAQFEEDLKELQKRGYVTVTMADVLDFVDNGTPLPDKPIMLTFDDGYYNNYLFADPLLERYGMKAVLSPVCKWTEVYSDTPGQSDHAIYSHVTWQEIREMIESGRWEIQNHSYDMHYCEAGKRKGTLRRTSETAQDYEKALRMDLSTAQRQFTALAGVTPTTFTYPYGAMCDEALPIIKDLGFRATLTCESRVNRITRDAECLYGLGRHLRPSGIDSAAYFAKMLK